MNSEHKLAIHAVPTNIITGFLGVGKTSTIAHLLKHKPKDERWAVLVNEFGEIGVDGALLKGASAEESGVFIREVPGGCMCCAAGVSMHVALNQLLSKAQPDRLLIEPTGLGHPKEVLKVLSGQHFQGVLSIQKVITLVDARQLSDRRYTEHETFNQQIAMADVIVGNKQDLYQQSDYTQLERYIHQNGSLRVHILMTHQGVVDLAHLEGISGVATDLNDPDEHHHDHANSVLENVPVPATGYVHAIKRGEGFESVGWRFTADRIFSHEKLLTVLSNFKAERVKGVFITDEGVFGYNIAGEEITQTELSRCQESRIEIISTKLSDEWGKQLMECMV